MAIHCRIHADNSPLNYSPILKLNGYLLAVQLLQKFNQLHRLIGNMNISVDRLG